MCNRKLWLGLGSQGLVLLRVAHLNCPDEWLSREAEVSKNECLDKAYAKTLKCKKHGIVRNL